MQQKKTYDICIIGAGVAGASLANTLLNSNLHVCIIEKDWHEQDRIVGELLQPDGVKQLQEMDLDNLLDGFDAQDITGYTIIHQKKELSIDYPANFKGKGLRNGKFLQNMRERLFNASNIDCLEAEVSDLIYSDSGQVVGVNLKSNQEDGLSHIHATMTIVTDGFFSKMRKYVTDSKEKVTGYFLGMELAEYSLPNNQHGHVFLTDKNPFLCYPISSTHARLLIDFTTLQAPRKGEELTNFLVNEIRPYLTESMLPSFDKALQLGKFKVMPNHYMPSKERIIDGVVVLGDALNMRHPITGGGMTVTLRDVKTISSLLKTIEINNSTNRIALLQTFYTSRHQHATVNILADALHEVMGNKELKIACFDYLYKGGKKASEPIALLSGLEKRKTLLAKHFFAVAFQGGAKKIRNNWQLENWSKAYEMVGDAYQIIYPLIKNETRNKATHLALDFGKKMFTYNKQVSLIQN